MFSADVLLEKHDFSPKNGPVPSKPLQVNVVDDVHLGMLQRAYRGVGVPNALESGERAVTKVLADFGMTLEEDAVVEKRIEGLPALKELFDRYRGIPLFDSYEILNPMVQTAGDVVILTYQLAQRNGSATTYWNATEVYQRKDQGWRIIHTHWSAAKAQQP